MTDQVRPRPAPQSSARPAHPQPAYPHPHPYSHGHARAQALHRTGRDREAGSAEPAKEQVKVFLGQHAVGGHPGLMLMTTLGSCVTACIHDPVLHIGGMNHFLLPEVPESELNGTGVAARYGSVAMERLINDLLAMGARRERLQVKLFGGASVIVSSSDVGGQNARFALDYVRCEGLTLAGQDLGGVSARRLHYFPHSGRAMRRLLNPAVVSDTVTQEMRFMSDLRHRPVDGDVELFGDE